MLDEFALKFFKIQFIFVALSNIDMFLIVEP